MSFLNIFLIFMSFFIFSYFLLFFIFDDIKVGTELLSRLNGVLLENYLTRTAWVFFLFTLAVGTFAVVISNIPIADRAIIDIT